MPRFRFILEGDGNPSSPISCVLPDIDAAKWMAVKTMGAALSDHHRMNIDRLDMHVFVTDARGLSLFEVTIRAYSSDQSLSLVD